MNRVSISFFIDDSKCYKITAVSLALTLHLWVLGYLFKQYSSGVLSSYAFL